MRTPILALALLDFLSLAIPCLAPAPPPGILVTGPAHADASPPAGNSPPLRGIGRKATTAAARRRPTSLPPISSAICSSSTGFRSSFSKPAAARRSARRSSSARSPRACSRPASAASFRWAMPCTSRRPKSSSTASTASWCAAPASATPSRRSAASSSRLARQLGVPARQARAAVRRRHPQQPLHRHRRDHPPGLRRGSRATNESRSAWLRLCHPPACV